MKTKNGTVKMFLNAITKATKSDHLYRISDDIYDFCKRGFISKGEANTLSKKAYSKFKKLKSAELQIEIEKAIVILKDESLKSSHDFYSRKLNELRKELERIKGE